MEYDCLKGIKEVTQGIEIEGYVRGIDHLLDPIFDVNVDNYINGISLKLNGRKVFGKIHRDTGRCTEIATHPFSNLGDLMDSLREISATVLEVCNDNKWVYMLLGVTPVAGYAGGHIHVSYSSKGKNSSEVRASIRDRLRRFQPFIALLGQNSPISMLSFPYIVKRIFDSRLEVMGSELTSKDYHGFIFDNFLVDKPNYGSVEVRLPSVAPIYQSIGSCVFLKACLQNQIKTCEMEKTQSLTNSIIQNGATAAVNLEMNNKVKCITAGELLKLIMNNETFSNCLGEIFDELPTKEIKLIKNFFESFFNGMSMTSYYIKALYKKPVLEACKELHAINEEEVAGTPVYKQVSINANVYRKKTGMPIAIQANIFDITPEQFESIYN